MVLFIRGEYFEFENLEDLLGDMNDIGHNATQVRLGQMAYCAYCARLDHHQPFQKTLSWDRLPPHMRDCWVAVAEHLLGYSGATTSMRASSTYD